MAPWEGTASDLLVQLNVTVPEEIRRQKGWFTQPRRVGDALRRLAPELRRTGLGATFIRAPHTGRRMIRLEKMGDGASPASPDSENQPLPGDEAGDARLHWSPSASPKNTHKSGLGDDGDDGDAAKHLFPERAEDDDSAGDREVLDV